MVCSRKISELFSRCLCDFVNREKKKLWCPEGKCYFCFKSQIKLSDSGCDVVVTQFPNNGGNIDDAEREMSTSPAGSVVELSIEEKCFVLSGEPLQTRCSAVLFCWVSRKVLLQKDLWMVHTGASWLTPSLARVEWAIKLVRGCNYSY